MNSLGMIPKILENVELRVDKKFHLSENDPPFIPKPRENSMKRLKMKR
jgi:hypothetical protein